MSSRKSILDAVKAAKGPLLEIPEAMQFPFVFNYHVEDFMRVLHSIGGQAIRCTEEELVHFLSDLQASESSCLDLRNTDTDTWERLKKMSPHDLATIDKILLESTLGVAENGAIWVTESDLPQRILPFICQHVVVCLRESSLVSNMHEAYQALQGVESGYGVFIAGPSKTADIEQSLVIGAHGPRSLLVYLVS
jgi:L-lactate dehydrogenase complex protein LldG